MKNVLLSLVMSSFATLSHAQSWELVAKGTDGAAFFIDADSMRIASNGGTKVWLRTEYTRPRNQGSAKGVKELLTLTEFHCGQGAYTSLDYVMRNQRGGVVTSGQDMSRLAVVPGSIGSALYERVCPGS